MSTSKISGAVSHFFAYSVPKFLNVIKNFLVNTFEITSTKKSKITGASVAGILLLAVIVFNSQFTGLLTNSKWLLLAFALVAPFIIGAFITFNIKIKNSLINSIWHFVFFILSPIITMTMTECLNNIFIYDMTYLGFLANYLVILLLLFLIFAFCGSFRVSLLITNTVCYGLALAHCYVVLFRGTPFVPMDFLSVTTAVNVANTYNFTPTHTVIIGSLIFIFLTVIGIKIKTPKYTAVTKIVSRTFMGTFFVCLICLFYFTSIFANAGVKPDFWNQSRGYRNYGFVFSFFCNTKYLYMTEPNGYNAETIGDYVSSTVDKDEPVVIKPSGNEPNIICIMNESLSDLSVMILL